MDAKTAILNKVWEQLIVVPIMMALEHDIRFRSEMRIKGSRLIRITGNTFIVQCEDEIQRLLRLALCMGNTQVRILLFQSPFF